MEITVRFTVGDATRALSHAMVTLLSPIGIRSTPDLPVKSAIVPGSFWWRSSATSNARLPELLKRPCRAAPRNASRCTGKREPGIVKLKFYKVL